MERTRIDAVLAERGVFPSRTAAASAVRAGEVRVGRDGPIALRPSQLVEPGAELIVDEGPRYVSRGGTKLENALTTLAIDVTGLDCLDVGASTGGFSDCMLQRGAARVAAVDVAYGQLDAGLRDDPRVTAIERLNARVESFNLFNHPNFDLPLNNVSGGGFGSIVNTVSPATNPYGAFLSVPLTGRIVQLNARVTF